MSCKQAVANLLYFIVRFHRGNEHGNGGFLRVHGIRCQDGRKRAVAGVVNKFVMIHKSVILRIVCKDGYTIHIYFLMAGGRVPTKEECTGMQEYFDTVKRPMGDLVLCHAPEEIPYDIELTYHIALSNVKNASTIQENVEAAVKEYETWQRKIGRDIEPAELIMRVREAGAKRPRLLTPVETTVSEIQVAKLRSCKVTYGGIEDD